MSSDLRPRRLLLSTTALELLRRQVLGPEQQLPPGFALAPDDAPSDAQERALRDLVATGVASTSGDAWTPHPAVADDLRLLAAPELAVTVHAARPGLQVSACLALSGPRGAALLRTGDSAVQLSAFASQDLAAELARVVPAPLSELRAEAEDVPLDALLAGGASSRLRGRVPGTLRATVLGPEDGPLGSVQWVWDGRSWAGLEPLPTRDGRPWVRLVGVLPGDLPAWLAPLVAAAAVA